MISQAHKQRMESMEGHLLYHKPATYWDQVQAILISHLVILNSHENLAELEVRIGSERLYYSVDRTALLSVGGRTEPVRDRSMLSILASTFEALTRELFDPEWQLFTKSHKRRKMLKTRSPQRA
ncbi:MAG: hypothetical protein R6U58_08310 [Bacteroidales bacterium]